MRSAVWTIVYTRSVLQSIFRHDKIRGNCEKFVNELVLWMNAEVLAFVLYFVLMLAIGVVFFFKERGAGEKGIFP